MPFKLIFDNAVSQVSIYFIYQFFSQFENLFNRNSFIQTKEEIVKRNQKTKMSVAHSNLRESKQMAATEETEEGSVMQTSHINSKQIEYKNFTESDKRNVI